LCVGVGDEAICWCRQRQAALYPRQVEFLGGRMCNALVGKT
jgi:hypothetical protein